MEKTEELLKEISQKLDQLIGITAIQNKNEEKQVKILRSLDFTFKKISNLTGIPEGTLKIREHRKKKK